MSQTEKPTVDVKYEKDVQIVAYLYRQNFEDKREAAQWLDDGRDYQSRTTSESSSFQLITGVGSLPIDEEQYKAMQRMDIGDLSVRKESTVETGYTYTARTAAREVLKAVYSEAPSDFGGLETKTLTSALYNSKDVKVVKHRTRGPKTMGLLKHQSDAMPDDMWEDEDAELWCVTLNVSLGPVGKELLDKLSEEYIGYIVKELATKDWCERVRWNQCVETQKKEGVCYDV